MLPLVLLAACGGRVPFPEGADAYFPVTLRGTSSHDMWWPDCGSGALDLWHHDGGGWSVVEVPEFTCVEGSQVPAAPEGPGVLWVSGRLQSGAVSSGLLRVTADGDVEDHTDSLPDGLLPSVLASSGTDVFGLTGDHPDLTLVHFAAGQFEGSHAVPPRPDGAALGQLIGLAALSPTHVFVDHGAIPCSGDYGCGPAHTLWHFDGQEWTYTEGPSATAIGLGFPADDAWALLEPQGGSVEMAVSHWDGAAWTPSVLPLPAPPLAGFVGSFTTNRRGDLITVGSLTPGVPGTTLVTAAFRLDGSTWKQIAVITQTPAYSGCSGYGPCGIKVSGRFEDGSYAIGDWGTNATSHLDLYTP